MFSLLSLTLTSSILLLTPYNLYLLYSLNVFKSLSLIASVKYAKLYRTISQLLFLLITKGFLAILISFALFLLN